MEFHKTSYNFNIVLIITISSSYYAQELSTLLSTVINCLKLTFMKVLFKYNNKNAFTLLNTDRHRLFSHKYLLN